MNEPLPPNHRPKDYGSVVGTRARRKLQARRQPTGVWFGLGMMGLIGWSIVVPTLLGAALGVWLDGRLTGRISWTLSLLLLGLGVGCVNAWHWVIKEDRAIGQGAKDSDDE